MNLPFPLPRAPQHSYTKWYNHTVKGGTFNKYTILWVGSQLDCRFKSDTLAEKIGPHHVFILKKNQTFAHVVIDNTDTIYKLPKKYHTACFPGIQYNSIPKNNMIDVQVTKRKKIKLPFIPPSFLQQKKAKTSRTKRRRTQSTDDVSQIENIDFSKQHPTWHVLTNDQIRNDPLKKDIMLLIRSIINYSHDTTSFNITNPFSDITSVDDIRGDENKLKKLKNIIGFIFYFCRSELGVHDKISLSTNLLEEWIGDLNNTATV